MADAVLIFTSDNRPAADRLRSAIAQAGYSLGASKSEADQSRPSSVAEKLASAGAVIVIWSKEALASDVVVAAAKEAERQGKLIQVSVDGIKPVGSVDSEMRVALLSGWRGEPFHPGWQKIEAELKRLCGRRGSAAAPIVAPKSGDHADKSSRQPAGIAAADAPPALKRTRPQWFGILAAVMVLLILVGAATSWLRMRGSSPEQPQEASGKGASAMPREAASAAVEATGSETPRQPQVLDSIASPPAPGDDLRATESVDPATKAKTAAKAEPATLARGKQGQGSASRASANSPATNMRLFCERSGRGTRECREFLRRVARRSGQSLSAAATSAPVSDRYSRNMRRFCEGAGRGTSECRLFRRRLRSGSD